jgi:LPS-assembly lipoprotein
MLSPDRTGVTPLLATRRATRVMRALGAWLVVALAGALMASCGFALRQSPELDFKRIALRGFARDSAMAEELRRQLRASPGVEVVDVANGADAVITALQDVLERVVAASTSAGQVRELTLHARLKFDVRDATGRELIGATELLQTRDMSYTESNALAKEQEARLLGRAMQADVASQVLRRLAALSVQRRAAGSAAASSASAPTAAPGNPATSASAASKAASATVR